MKQVLLIFCLCLIAVVVVMALWRQSDHRADRGEAARLRALQPASPAAYDPAMVADLPEPARRYFNHAIQPGTPLFTVADITMQGKLGLGDKAKPNYIDFTGSQVLAAPTGFLWKMTGGQAPMRVSGSDSGEWTRFWLAGLAPVARAGGTADHRQSAFARYVAEAIAWAPASVLPGPGVVWEQAGPDAATLTLTHDGMTQSATLTLDTTGRMTQITLPRWSNANPDKVFRTQPFGGYVANYQDFQGFRLPTQVEVGNMFGTPDYFPFFMAQVLDIQFPLRPVH